MSEAHDLDAEKAVLGAVLQDRDVLPQVRALLRVEDFYAQGHGKIFGAMLSLAAEGQPVDHLTIAERLQARNQLAAVGGPAYLMQLDQLVPASSSARRYAEIIRDRANRRRLAAIGRRLADLSADLELSPGDVQAKASRALAALSSGSYQLRTLTEIGADVYTRLEDVESGKAEPVIPTGIKALDNVIAGLQATLIVVGARTGVGKSAFAAAVTENVAQYFAGRERGERVGVISLEDEAEWLGYRLLAYRSGVNGFVLRYRKKSDRQWEQIGEGAARLRVYSDNVLVDDRPSLTSWEIAQVADDMVINHGVRCLLIDHNSEIDHHAHKRDTLEQNITRSLVDLRGISKRHGIPVVLLCQMLESDKVKPGDFQGIAGIMHAREIVKKSRVFLELARAPESDKMAIRVWKHTNGQGDGRRDVEVEFVGAAAMIRDLEGAQADLELEPPASPPKLTVVPPPAPVRASAGYVLNPDERENE